MIETAAEWGWELEAPPLTAEEIAMLDVTVEEIMASPISLSVDPKTGKSAVWRFLEGAQWRLEPARGKRVSTFFLETLAWRDEEGVDDILLRGVDFKDQAAGGKLFLRGTCRLGRPLIWLHLGRDSGNADPAAEVQFLIYTVERAIASMSAVALGPPGKGQFCVVVDCSMVTGMGQLPSVTFVRQATTMLMLRYPARLGKLFIVNAGLAVHYLWQGIALLLPQATRDKVEIVSGMEEQRQDALLKHISADALVGGKLGCTGCQPFDAECYLAGGDAGGARCHFEKASPTASAGETAAPCSRGESSRDGQQETMAAAVDCVR